MPLPLLLALFLAFGLDTSGVAGSPPRPAPLPTAEIVPRVLETLGGVLLVGVFAFVLGRLVARAVKQQGRASGRVRRAYRIGCRGVEALGLVVFGWVIYGLEWPRVVRTALGMGDPVLLDDALILLPFLLAQLAGWWGVYAAERALRLAGTGEAVGLGRFLALKARQSLGMVLPVAIVYAVGSDLVHRRWPNAVNSPWDQPVSLALMGFLVLIFAPALVRLAWPTRPLPPGPLRDRLERVAQRVGFRCTDILVWDTGRLLVNAGVTGSLPWFRYVFLSDSLIEDLDVHEVAAVFGHEIGHIAHRHLVYFGFFILGSLSVIALAGGAINEALGAVPMPLILAAGTPGALVVEGIVTLVIVGGYFFLAFGFLSRRFEGQADVFGCRVVSCGRPECPPHADLDARPAATAVLARTRGPALSGRCADLHQRPAKRGDPQWDAANSLVVATRQHPAPDRVPGEPGRAARSRAPVSVAGPSDSLADGCRTRGHGGAGGGAGGGVANSFKKALCPRSCFVAVEAKIVMTDSSRAEVAVIKACLGLAGLWLLLRTEPSAPNSAYHQGQMLFKISAGLVLLLAAIPWRGPRSKAPDAPDEL